MEHELNPFSTPQRQSKTGIIVEIAYSLIKLIKAWWPFLLIVLFRYDNDLYKITGFTLLILFSVVLGYLNYRNFSFMIDEEREEFIIQSGIFNKKRSVLQLSKIQQVSINQSFIQKLTHVYGVEIKTAGSTRSEAEIKAVSEEIAKKIKNKLSHGIEHKAEKEKATNISPQQVTFSIAISPLNLLKTGITSRYFESAGLLVAFFFTILNNLKDIGYNYEGAEKQFISGWNSITIIQSTLIFVISLVFITLLFNVARIMIVYYDLKISQNAYSLFVSYGLFNSKNTLINPNKVQITRLSSNYFQRKLNIFQLSILQASSDIARDKKATVRIPGCNKQDSDSILAFIYHSKPVKGYCLRPNWRKSILPNLIFIVIPVIVYIFFRFQSPVVNTYLGLIIAYCCVVLLCIYYSYRNNSLSIHEDFIIKKSGIWDVETEIIEPYKIQSIRTKQYYWHRKSNIGHLILHTAGGDISFKFTDFENINKYVNRWIYQIETSKKEWM